MQWLIQPCGSMSLVQLDALREAVSDLVGCDPYDYGDAASVEELHRLRERLDAFVTLATSAFDASGEWALDGAKNAASWISTRCKIPRARARAEVSCGRRLRDLEATKEAWLEGDIASPHVRAIGALSSRLAGRAKDAMEESEEMLVGFARDLRFCDFERALSYFEQMSDPDGTEEREELRRSRRDVYLESSFEGTWFGKMTLDPVSGSIVREELDRLEKEMYLSDWQRAKEASGHDPRPDELERTPSERRADALVEMARRSKSSPPDAVSARVLISVLVDYPTLLGRVCELANGQVITPGTLLGLLDEAYVERVVFEGPDRIAVGPSSRFFTGATRRAIEIRDGRCTHPYCEEPASRCQVDHIVPYAKDGPTTIENGRLLCGFHNRLREKRTPPRDTS